jgi:tRNA nucleotidyltransferase (CCA-adding enzyme)
MIAPIQCQFNHALATLKTMNFIPPPELDFADVYLVGGAVRDHLLQRPVKDRDWVVVGATPDQLLAAGFTAVGADFPVFLHPESKEEFALARTERKTAAGYHGFQFHAAADVSLEQDLARRDLTINAIAMDRHGQLIDPFGGAQDLQQGVLRHVSPAFVEDPVRVLRIARFAARYAPLGFRVAPETMALLAEIVQRGECAHLVSERVFDELRKALSEAKPSAFLRCLRECGALAVVFPEIDALYGVAQRVEFHPEVDTGVHQEMVSDQAALIAPGDTLVGFCALLHDLGKAMTPKDQLPKHFHHEENGIAPVRALCQRLRVPSEWAACAEMVCREHLNVHRLLEARAGTIVDLLSRIDAWRKPDRVRVLALACWADKRGRLGLTESAYPQADRLRQAFAIASSTDTQALIDRGLVGADFGVALRLARCQVLATKLAETSQ